MRILREHLIRVPAKDRAARRVSIGRVGAVLALAVALCACGAKKAAPPPPPPVAVKVVTLKTQSVSLTTDLPGRTVPYRVAEIRPQVSGVILKRMFVEGADVKEGQQLYQIDPALYQAAYDSAAATAESSRLQAQRYKPLAEAKRQQTGLRQCRSRGCAKQGVGRNRAHQPRLYALAVADLRSHRALVRHRRCIGYCEPDDVPGDGTAARSDLCGRDAADGRSAAAETRDGRWPTRPGGRQPGGGSPAARGRQPLRVDREVAVLGSPGRPGHGLGDPAGLVPHRTNCCCLECSCASRSRRAPRRMPYLCHR